MQAASFGFGFIFSILAGSGGGELLDYIDTATYWPEQGVAEVSVETMTAQLVDQAVEPDKIDQHAVYVYPMWPSSFSDTEAMKPAKKNSPPGPPCPSPATTPATI